MNDTEKNPLTFKLDFNHTKTKALEKKLLSGEISFEEWKNALQEDFDKKLSELN